MTDAELILVDGRPDVREAIAAQPCHIPYALRGRFPRSVEEGAVITVGEYANAATACPVVDEIAYQIDIWAFDRETVVALSQTVNSALTALGLKRQYAGPDGLSDDPVGYCTKTLRYGRRVDKRSMRLID